MMCESNAILTYFWKTRCANRSLSLTPFEMISLSTDHLATKEEYITFVLSSSSGNKTVSTWSNSLAIQVKLKKTKLPVKN